MKVPKVKVNIGIGDVQEITTQYNYLLQAIERHNFTKKEFDDRMALIQPIYKDIKKLIKEVDERLEKLELSQKKTDKIINKEYDESSYHRKVCNRNCLMVEQHMKYCGLDVDES